MNRKAIRLEVTPAEMRYLRESEGLTNKQIAERLNISVNTVYRYIGKRSYAIANAQAQNKPCPVPDHIATGLYEDESVEVENTMEQKKTRRFRWFGFLSRTACFNPVPAE